MSNQSGQLYGGGFREGYVFALNSSGRIAGNSASIAYEGIPLIGAKNFNLTEQKMRVLNHMGSDRVQAADFLPPTQVSEAGLAVSANDQQLQALLTNTKQTFLGEMAVTGRLSSQQGYEPNVALVVTQQAEDADKRVRVWHHYSIARARMIPHGAAFADRETDGSYDVVLIPSRYGILGTQFTVADDGYTDAQYQDFNSEGLLGICAYLGDGSVTTFAFPTSRAPAKSINKVVVTVDGVVQSSGITVTTAHVVFATAPALNADIGLKWEY
jgi:hypothetical protein